MNKLAIYSLIVIIILLLIWQTFFYRPFDIDKKVCVEYKKTLYDKAIKWIYDKEIMSCAKWVENNDGFQFACYKRYNCSNPMVDPFSGSLGPPMGIPYNCQE